MGIFDFFNKKDKVETAPETNNEVPQRAKEYLGDLEKTGILAELVKTPKAERDEQWQETFLANVSSASFRCGEPQVAVGPDGYPYFQLHLPEPNKSFQCFVIDEMKDHLLKSGFGIVINPAPDSADWVFSYGDVLNLELTNTFYTDGETPFSKVANDETIDKDEKVMVGQPSEKMLPKAAREIISKQLKENGIETPKVVLLMRTSEDGKDISQDLAFNVTPKDFDDENRYRAVMKSIGWYLPRHYSYVGMEEKSLGHSFMPL